MGTATKKVNVHSSALEFYFYVRLVEDKQLRGQLHSGTRRVLAGCSTTWVVGGFSLLDSSCSGGRLSSPSSNSQLPS
ncbi:hypothetical protein TYRP_003902 [Tyrophagus putrescentiae]|nr:hypothetical protein TYRP_003902 [Tyrophagus putrescentiae]